MGRLLDSAEESGKYEENSVYFTTGFSNKENELFVYYKKISAQPSPYPH